MELTQVIKDEDGNFTERELIHAPLAWQLAGLQQTQTGYGSKLTSQYKMHFAGKVRRIYYRCYSNNASFFVMLGKERRYLCI